MTDNIQKLRDKYDLDIISPFNININNKEYNFQALIKGYGAIKGMIIDDDWNNLEKVNKELIDLGYGISCFDIYGDNEIDGWQEVLDDWGKTKT